MPLRCTPVAAPGSLLKGPKPVKTKPVRVKRERDEGHLEAVRQCPCLACLTDPAGEAAHLRFGDLERGKQSPGIGRKPADKHVLPLCHTCHMDQHANGELSWWRSHGIDDPLRVAAALYELSPNVEALRAAVFACHAVNALERER